MAGLARAYAVRVAGGQRTLVGGCGFLGGPDATGMVEMGYSVLPQFQRQGIATEMVAGMTAWAFTHAAVRTSKPRPPPKRGLVAGAFARRIHRGGRGREPGSVRLRLERAA